MFVLPLQTRTFVVVCKGCGRNVPAAEKFPLSSLPVRCALCGEERMYRPSETFLGKPHPLLKHQGTTRVKNVRS